MPETRITTLAGNLCAVTLPAASDAESDRMYTSLKEKYGGKAKKPALRAGT